MESMASIRFPRLGSIQPGLYYFVQYMAFFQYKINCLCMDRRVSCGECLHAQDSHISILSLKRAFLQDPYCIGQTGL